MRADESAHESAPELFRGHPREATTLLYLSKHSRPERHHGHSDTAANAKANSPDLLFLAFLDFLALLLFEEFLAFLSVFPSFSKD